jgi:ribosomal protein S8
MQINFFTTFLQSFNVNYNQYQIYVDIKYCSNFISMYLIFLYYQHLLLSLYFFKDTKTQVIYCRVYYRFSQINSLLFKQIQQDTRKLGITLKMLKKHQKIFGLNYFPILILQTKQGLTTHISALQNLLSGQLHSIISK